MNNLQLTQMPVAIAEMLIRRPVAEVFEAFINPATTSKFWFTSSSGRLEPGKQVQWDWEMYDFSVQVTVLAIEEQKRILIEWSAYGTPTMVEWIFTARLRSISSLSKSRRGSWITSGFLCGFFRAASSGSFRESSHWICAEREDV